MADLTAKYILSAEDRTKAALKSAQRGFGDLTDNVTKYVGLLTGVLAGVSFKGLVDQAVTTASEIDNLSKKLGGSVEEWSRLRHAAEETDVGFNVAATAAQRASRRIAEAAIGTGEAVKALDELGLSAKALTLLTPLQQLHVLADALKGVEGQSDRVRLAMKLFDSEGVKLLQMLDNGSAGLRELEREADRLGKTLTTEGVAKLAEYEDATKEMGSAVEALSTQLASAFAPGLAAAARSMAGFIQNARELGLFVRQQFGDVSGELDTLMTLRRRALRQYQEAIADGFAKDSNWVRILKIQFNDLTDQIIRLQKLRDEKDRTSPQDVPLALGDGESNGDNKPDGGDKPGGSDDEKRAERLAAQYATALEALQRAKVAVGETTEYERTLWEVQRGRYRDLTAQQQQALLDAAAAVDAKRQEIQADQELAEARTQAAQAQAEYNRDQEAAAQRWRELLNPMEEVDNQLVQLDQLLAEGRISWSSYGDALFHVMEQMDEAADKTADTAGKFDEFGKQAARNIQSSFADFLFNPFDQGLQGMLSGFINTIHRMVSEMLAQQLLKNFFTSMAGGDGGSIWATLAAGVKHGGGIAGGSGVSRTVPALAFAGAPRLHSGGIAGLKPNEVPTILEKGEGVFTEEQMAAMGGGASQAPQSVSIALVDDRKSYENYLASNAGGKTVLMHIQQNAQAVKRLLT